MDTQQLVHDQLTRAHESAHGRSTQIVVHDGPLRQTVIALTKGTRLPEHNSPPAGSILVLRGTISVSTADRVDTLPTGFLVPLTRDRHSVEALSDAVFLLTAVTSTGEPSHP